MESGCEATRALEPTNCINLQEHLVIKQPTLLLWLISPGLYIFPNHNLWLGFHDLIQVMNQFQPYFPDG